MRASRRLAVLSGLAIGALVQPVSGAAAATTIGETFVPNVPCSPGAGTTYIQSTTPSASNSYAAPSAGVITSWSFQAAATAPASLKLKVVRPAGGASFTTVGESAPETPAASTLHTFPARITVQAGDRIGYFAAGASFPCARIGAGGVISFTAGDPAPGTSAMYGTNTSAQQDVAAQLEPDADADGFGDETQDQCATNATTQGTCPLPASPPAQDTSAPDTTITKGAPNKTDAEKVKIKFTSSEANSTFECKVGRKPYMPCTSPKKVKVEEGKNKFKVRAKDAAGNVDPTPAKEAFKGVED